MGSRVQATAITLFALSSLGLAPVAAHADVSRPANDCTTHADQQGLHGAARQSSIARCMKAITSPPPPNPQLQKSAVTSPSGSNPTQRAAQCTAEAERRHLQYPARQSFQHTCLSGIGPVTTIGTPLHRPSKRGAVAGLGVVANGQQH